MDDDDVGASGWADRLAGLLGPRRAEEARAFAGAVPAGYRERVTPEDAAFDLDSVVDLERASDPAAGGGRHRFGVRASSGSVPGSFRLRRVGTEPVELSHLLPLMESFGLVVIEAFPQWIDSLPGSARRWHIDDVGVRLRAPPTGAGFDPAVDGDRLLEALAAVVDRTADVDSLNRLVLTARLDWRQVVVLRAYRRYLHQAGTRWSAGELDDALDAYPDVTRALDSYITARFDPRASPTPAGTASARHAALDAIGRVSHLQQDQILRLFLAVVDATVRTNVFTDPPPFAADRAVTLQLDSARVPCLTAPRPRVETFVHGPEVEGVHLRSGLIARGGLRWSDRPDDFRTEVLDLAQAQVKKNAIIVPTGAKGGFVVRRRPGDTLVPVSPADVRAAYEVFVGSLLDITDNVVGGAVVHPPGVLAPGDDPYLVVAADRGTATFSDVANAISEQRRFWLGDAFASGGSRGYDHKALGITARGAWVAVRRHFHQLGVDPQTEPIRVVGVGDMSGDVFGNGMLMSGTIRLVAAFDHRHVFVDPDPDPVRSFAERRRLAALDRSSWGDYDRSVLSAGAGIWSRDAKAIELSGPARRALGFDAAAPTPPELIAAILAAPVDLLWFGGIGTYIRAPDESDMEVGDRANDGVRITSNEIRARVVAEGGNLGATQRGRIRYSRRGGRINTDFIDNAAGVAISDREVNLKILLALAIEDGTIDQEDRDRLLVEVTADVVDAVLHQVDNSVVALARAVPRSAAEIDAYEALIVALERCGQLDRQVESLPDAAEMATRRQAGAGLIRPELAVLLAYAKSALVVDLEAAGVTADPALLDSVTPYFPGPIVRRFASLIPRHRLYPQLVATDVAGEIVDQMGITWAHETAAALHRTTVDVAMAFWAARQVLGAGLRWEELVASTAGVFAPGADLDLEAHRLIATAVDVVARRYLTRPGLLPLGEVIAQDCDVAAALAAGPLGFDGARERDRLISLGADPAVGEKLGRWAAAVEAADVAALCRSSGAAAVPVGQVLGVLDEVADLRAIAGAMRAAGEASRWSAWQAQALEADLRDWRVTAAGQLLDHHRGPDEIAKAVAAWRDAGAFAAVDELRGHLGGGDDLTVVALVVRALPRLR